MHYQAVALRALYTLHKEETRHFADSLILKATLQWLLAHQGEDGSFTEAYLYEGFRNGQLPRAAQKTPLTAQVLILLSDIANEVWKGRVRDQAKAWLDPRLHESIFLTPSGCGEQVHAT